MRRLILSVVLVAVALAAQLTIVNRLSLPGGAGPDLVLLVVVALALTGGPLPGVLTGFLAGLALDVAPPASHTVGEYALVFCIVGYGCGRLAGLGEESPALLYVAISAGAAAVGAVLYAGLGVMLSDPEVTWASVQHVLPPAVVYNVLLSPFVLFGVVKLNGWISSSDAVVGPSAAISSAATSALGGAGLAGAAVRQASASGSPKLRLGERRGGDAWIASARSASAARPAGLATSQREPRLRLSGQRSSGGSASGLGTSTARYSAPKIAPKMNFRGARSPFAGRSGASGSVPRSGAKPKFRKRTTTPAIGTSSALSRATPRRGTFARRRSFGKSGSLGRRSALSGRSMPRGSAPRLKMRRAHLAGSARATAGPEPEPGRISMMSASRRRLLVLYVVVFTLLITLGGRLWYIQVMNGTSYVKLASQNQTRKIIVPAVRGQILDDEGNPLVANRTELVVSVDMMTLSQRSDGGTSVLKRLAPMLNMSYQLLAEKTRLCTAKVKQPCWAGSPYQPIPVDENVSEQVALQIMEEQNEFPGISAQTEGVVTYQFPHGANPAQVVGYLQPATTEELKEDHLPSGVGYSTADEVGQAGLEEQYNQALTGKTGTNTVSVNAAGDVTGSVASAAAQPGDDLVTSLNSQIQADAQNALASAIKKARDAGNDANQGAAVVMTTKGQVVAMASYPDYNPSVWTNGITQSEFDQLFGSSDGAPAINYATQGQYAPGSTWKVTSTAAGVADGYGLDQTYNCPASVTIGGHEYKNDGEPSLGQMSYAEALIQSCDTVYYDLGYDMWQTDNPGANVVTSATAPVQKMQQMALDWGFGKATGIDLPEESTGTVPTREWLYYYWKDNAYTGQDWCKNGKADGTYVQQIEYQDCKTGNVWEPGQAAIAAIGQGYDLSTPLQLANAYVALANGGTLYQPRIGEALISPSGQVVQQIEPTVAGHLPVSKNTLAYIRNALQGVVTQGTAASAFGGYPEDKACVAGKTGTAQVLGKVATSVFASFAPCNDPKYVVVVMIPDAGYGADVSAPAVRQIWDGIYGLEGHKAAVPNGQVPSTLPQIASTGKITAPKGYSG